MNSCWITDDFNHCQIIATLAIGDLSEFGRSNIDANLEKLASKVCYTPVLQPIYLLGTEDSPETAG